MSEAEQRAYILACEDCANHLTLGLFVLRGLGPDAAERALQISRDVVYMVRDSVPTGKPEDVA